MKRLFPEKNVQGNQLEIHFEPSVRECCSGKPGLVARASPTMGVGRFGWAINRQCKGGKSMPLHLHLQRSLFHRPEEHTLLSSHKLCVHLGMCTQIESSADTLARHHCAPLIKNAFESVEKINQYFWLLSQQSYFTKQSAR